MNKFLRIAIKKRNHKKRGGANLKYRMIKDNLIKYEINNNLILLDKKYISNQN